MLFRDVDDMEGWVQVRLNRNPVEVTKTAVTTTTLAEAPECLSESDRLAESDSRDPPITRTFTELVFAMPFLCPTP